MVYYTPNADTMSASCCCHSAFLAAALAAALVDSLAAALTAALIASQAASLTASLAAALAAAHAAALAPSLAAAHAAALAASLAAVLAAAVLSSPDNHRSAQVSHLGTPDRPNTLRIARSTVPSTTASKQSPSDRHKAPANDVAGASAAPLGAACLAPVAPFRGQIAHLGLDVEHILTIQPIQQPLGKIGVEGGVLDTVSASLPAAVPSRLDAAAAHVEVIARRREAQKAVAVEKVAVDSGALAHVVLRVNVAGSLPTHEHSIAEPNKNASFFVSFFSGLVAFVAQKKKYLTAEKILAS